MGRQLRPDLGRILAGERVDQHEPDPLRPELRFEGGEAGQVTLAQRAGRAGDRNHQAGLAAPVAQPVRPAGQIPET